MQSKKNVQWTGRDEPRFQAFFSALVFARFDGGESRPTQPAVKLVVERFICRYQSI